MRNYVFDDSVRNVLLQPSHLKVGPGCLSLFISRVPPSMTLWTWTYVGGGANHPRKLFQSIERQYTEYGAHNFFLPVHSGRGRGLGSKLNYMLKVPAASAWVSSANGLSRPLRILPNFQSRPHQGRRMPVILEVIRRTKKKYPDDVFVNGPPDTVTDVLEVVRGSMWI